MATIEYLAAYDEGYHKGIRDGSRFAVAIMKTLGVDEVVVKNEDAWFADRHVIEVTSIGADTSVVRYKEG